MCKLRRRPIIIDPRGLNFGGHQNILLYWRPMAHICTDRSNTRIHRSPAGMLGRPTSNLQRAHSAVQHGDPHQCTRSSSERDTDGAETVERVNNTSSTGADPLHHSVDGDEGGGRQLHGLGSLLVDFSLERSSFGRTVLHRSRRSRHVPYCRFMSCLLRTGAARRRCRTRPPTPRGIAALCSNLGPLRRKVSRAACDSQRS